MSKRFLDKNGKEIVVGDTVRIFEHYHDYLSIVESRVDSSNYDLVSVKHVGRIASPSFYPASILERIDDNSLDDMPPSSPRRKLEQYLDFLRNKVQLTSGGGLQPIAMHPSLFPHQVDCVRWALQRGKALIAASFGLGKTRISIELLRQVHVQTGRKVLVICPLGVKHQFMYEDGPAMDVRFAYVGTDEQAYAADTPYLITNYERVRDGQISEAFLKSEIAGVSLDEAAILGNLGTKTQQEFSRILSEIPYRWCATATPAPNDYRQMIYFADFLDAMDAGQALTRFFGRNPDKAGDLQLLPHMERDFWLWVASWALFVNTPGDLGYSDDGYVMPELNIHFHRLTADHEKAWALTVTGNKNGGNKNGSGPQAGQAYLFKDTSAGVTQAIREKHDSMKDRISQTLEIVLQYNCRQTSSKGDSDDSETGVQQEVLRREHGEGEAAQVGLVLSEQGEDRSGQAQSLHEGVSQDLQETEENAGGKGGNQPKETRAVRRRSGISGTGKGDSAQEIIEQAGSETGLSIEGHLWDNSSTVRGNSRSSGGRVRDLRSKANECDNAQGEDREEALRRSRPCDEQGAGHSLSPLQLRAGSIQGQSGIVNEGDSVPQEQLLIWCDLNEEQRAIESGLKKLGISFSSIYGSLSQDEVERRLYEWKDKKTVVLLSKPSMLGSGTNLQQSCKAIYAGVGFKFREFIQSIHRLQRYGQTHTVEVHIIHTDAEDHVVDVLMKKWRQHDEMVAKMRSIIREFGLTNEALTAGMQRTLGVTRQQAQGNWFTAINNDCVVETMTMADNSIDEIVTSIPFGNHYEYVASLNDFGHNQADTDFWTQMDFLIPELLRVLKPGRMACIHVKDRLLYGHQTPHGMMEVDYFSHDCARAFKRHGFVSYGEIFIPTDVVRENNSTNRLGWSENAKDGSKMGVGLSEKVLLFRKPQTDKTRSYADEPVRKDKYTKQWYECPACGHKVDSLNGLEENFVIYPPFDTVDHSEVSANGHVCPSCGRSVEFVGKSSGGYSRGRWQIDAHSLWRSNGVTIDRATNGHVTPDADPSLLIGMDGSQVYNWYKEWSKGAPYDYHQHVAFNEAMGDRLPARFMLMPPQAPCEYEETVWTDVLFMRTLNMNQARRRCEKHVCPLPLDIVERLIVRYSNLGEVILDMFSGLFTVPYVAIQLGRKAIGIELNSTYFEAGVRYCRDEETKRSTPTLFALSEEMVMEE